MESLDNALLLRVMGQSAVVAGEAGAPSADDDAWHPKHLARLAGLSRRFRVLVEEVGWRDATARYFPDVAAAVTEAHAAAEVSPAEWKATYKMLTHVPCVALHGALIHANAVMSMRGEHGAVRTLAAWSQRFLRADEDTLWNDERSEGGSDSESPALETDPRIFCGDAHATVVWEVPVHTGEEDDEDEDEVMEEDVVFFTWRAFCPNFRATLLHEQLFATTAAGAAADALLSPCPFCNGATAALMEGHFGADDVRERVQHEYFTSSQRGDRNNGLKHELLCRDGADDLAARVCANGHITVAWSAQLMLFNKAENDFGRYMANAWSMAMRMG